MNAVFSRLVVCRGHHSPAFAFFWICPNHHGLSFKLRTLPLFHLREKIIHVQQYNNSILHNQIIEKTPANGQRFLNTLFSAPLLSVQLQHFRRRQRSVVNTGFIDEAIKPAIREKIGPVSNSHVIAGIVLGSGNGSCVGIIKNTV